MKRLEHVRILMYSHDTFGLGHLRRCRTIAHSLVEHYKGVHVLIISGSPIAGAFDFRARVDFVKIPSVIKLHNGEYTSIDQHIDIQETLDMRMSMIHHTTKSFDPDIFIVDKEPLGLRGELEETLRYLKSQRCTLVLGLRDVMDSPELLRKEWSRTDMAGKIDELYDDIWVYGPKSFWDPLTGLDVPERLRERMTFTGFLDRTVPPSYASAPLTSGKYILVTAGGGGDGAGLLSQVLAAYEADPGIDVNAVMTLGPFMPAEERETLTERARQTKRVEIIEFHNRIEKLITDSAGVVGMCGYNTFCEILSFDKPALIVPRVKPRQEQYVRARRAQELGLLDMLHPNDAVDPLAMASALKALVRRPAPSVSGAAQMMGGLDVIADLTEELIARRDRLRLAVV